MSLKSDYKWVVIGRSVRGASHLRSSLDNQDAIGFRPKGGGGPPIFLAVSDGHGSAKSFRSRIGARYAVKAAISTASLFFDDTKKMTAPSPSTYKNAAERFLTANIIKRWQQKIERHFRCNPFTTRELERLEREAGESARRAICIEGQHTLAYGATLLLVAIGEGFLFYLQLGDGDILAVSDRTNQVEHPLPRDSTLIANETTSLCMDGAQKLFRFRFQHTQNLPPALILASTDGYSNSFSTTADFEQVGSDLLEIIRREGLDPVIRELPTWLEDASKEGSGDDVTLGIICRQDVVGISTNRGTTIYEEPTAVAMHGNDTGSTGDKDQGDHK